MIFSRREFLASSASTLAVGLAHGTRSRRRRRARAPPVTSFKDLRRGVGMFIGQGGTIGYLVNDAGVLAIDSQFPNTAAIALAGLKQRRRRVSTCCSTPTITAITPAATRCSAASPSASSATSTAWSRTARPRPTPRREGQQSFADTTFTDQWRTDFGDESIQARYYGPGHTGGDAVFHFEKANVVHMGDLLFNRAHPNIDRPAGARDRQLDQAARQGGRRPRRRHDLHRRPRQGQRRAVREGRPAALPRLPVACMDTARKAIAAGQSKDELQKMTSLKGFEDTTVAQRPAHAGLRPRHLLRRTHGEEIGPGASGSAARG